MFTPGQSMSQRAFDQIEVGTPVKFMIESTKRGTRALKVAATGAAPEVEEGMKRGDWKCQICGEINFAKREECWKCPANQARAEYLSRPAPVAIPR